MYARKYVCTSNTHVLGTHTHTHTSTYACTYMYVHAREFHGMFCTSVALYMRTVVDRQACPYGMCMFTNGTISPYFIV